MKHFSSLFFILFTFNCFAISSNSLEYVPSYDIAFAGVSKLTIDKVDNENFLVIDFTNAIISSMPAIEAMNNFLNGSIEYHLVNDNGSTINLSKNYQNMAKYPTMKYSYVVPEKLLGDIHRSSYKVLACLVINRITYCDNNEVELTLNE